jgi:hypothetical protein
MIQQLSLYFYSMYKRLIQHKYISNANAFVYQLHEVLTMDEKDELKEYLQTVDPDSLKWLEEHLRNDIYFYLKAKPEDKKNNDLWSKPGTKYYKHHPERFIKDSRQVVLPACWVTPVTIRC